MMPSGRKHVVEANGKEFGLTALEKQVIALVLAGYTHKESAQRIGLSEHSVSKHLRGIIAKLRVSNRLELVLFALHHHLAHPIKISPRLTGKRLSQKTPLKRAA